MTSPQEEKSDFVAALATTSIEDNLQITDLTAAEPHAEGATSELELEQPSTKIAQNDMKEEVVIKRGSPEEQKPEIPSIPEDGAAEASGQDFASQLANQYPAELMAGLPDNGMDGALDGALNILAGLTSNENPFQHLDHASAFAPAIDGLSGLSQAELDSIIRAHAAQNYLEPSPYLHEAQETRISAYARLEFPDGHFYMNTYSVILGRDLAAHRAATRREAELKQAEEDDANPNTPVRRKQESRHARSIVSEIGGAFRDGNDSNDEERAERRRQRKASKASQGRTKSTGSSSHQQSRRNSQAQPINESVLYQPQSQVRRSAPELANTAPLDPEKFRPSPYECPVIGIHPPADALAANYKSISRRHVKIKFNQKKHIWEAHLLGRNGAFMGDDFFPYQSIIPLKSGAMLQIGGVTVRFVLPDVALGETGGEERALPDDGDGQPYSRGGKQMSYDFEDTHGDGDLGDTSEESEDGGHVEEEEEEEEEQQDENEDEEGDEDGDEEGSDGQENDHEEVVEDDGDEEEEEQNTGRVQSLQRREQIEEAKGNNDQTQPGVKPKRGPGRPPKNGIMSKREQREAKKAAELAAQAQAQQKSAKQTAPPTPGAPLPTKNKVGRPRKHPRPPTPPEPREKRKYTKRKPKEPKDGEAKQEGSDDQSKEKKDKKPPKPPRSPTPTFVEADLTPEQLAKPNANYVTLIHEALSNSPNGQMSLPQIYRAIMRKYPYFVLRCSTNGWQSSVRHNLSQHHAFRKVERDGKGWMWAIVEGVSIEKEKKRRPTPPPQLPPGQMQQIYPQMMQGHFYGPGMMGPPPGYHPMQPHHMHPGQPPYSQQTYMNGHMPPPGLHPPFNGLPPPGYPPAIPAQLTASNNQSYSSPYAPKPPPPSEPQPNDQQPPVEEKPRAPPQEATKNDLVREALSNPPSQPPREAQQIQELELQPQPTTQPRQSPPPSQSLQTPQTQTQSQGPPLPSPPEPPRYNDTVMRAVETFRALILREDPNAVEVVTSAINRVLGITQQSTVPTREGREAVLMSTLSGMLTTMAGSDYTGLPTQSDDNRPSLPPSQASNETQAGGSHQPVNVADEKPTIARPSLMGQVQNRANGISIPRPPMTTPRMARTGSGGPANAPSRSSAPSASPAPTPAPAAAQGSPNGASTPKPSPREPAQLAGQKRSLDDADDMREFKKLSTSGPPQLKT